MSELIEPSQEGAVRVRYAKAAQNREASLCCPVNYDPRYLEAIPQEVIERDYGCGDPSQYLSEGETVLDLGSGTGKICFIASQVVGQSGRVIGIDMTDDMLEVARRSIDAVSANIGYSNVEFRKGRIQDLKLDLEALDKELSGQSISDSNGVLELEATMDRLRSESPLVENESIDVVVSNCVLNLVDADKKRTMFAELHRVLKEGGRAVISDIVSDGPVTEAMMEDSELWSGCLSGAMTERGFVQAFEEARFHSIRFRKFDLEPWRVIDGVVFRSVTIEACKGISSDGSGTGHSVLYRGPFKSVTDDLGRTFIRGERAEVGDADFQRYRSNAYEDSIVPIPSNSVRASDKSCSETGCC